MPNLGPLPCAAHRLRKGLVLFPIPFQNRSRSEFGHKIEENGAKFNILSFRVCVKLWGAVKETPLYGGVAEGRGGHDITRLLSSFLLFSSLIRFHPIIVPTPFCYAVLIYVILAPVLALGFLYCERTGRLMEYEWLWYAFFIVSGFCALFFLIMLKIRHSIFYINDFQKLLMSISTGLIQRKSEDMDKAISFALELIGKFFEADRSYVFLLSDYQGQESAPEEEPVMDNTHEWCAPGISPQIDNLQRIPQTVIPWWMEKIRENQVIRILDVDKLPEEASAEKQILQPQGIRSLLVIPLWLEGKAIGFIGFDFTKRRVRFSENVIFALRIAGETIVNALERKNYEDTLRAERDFAIQIMELLGQGLTLTNLDQTFEYVNPAFAKLIGYDPKDIIGKTPFDFTNREYHGTLQKEMKDRMNGYSGSYENTLIHKSGAIVPVMITSVPRLKKQKSVGSIAVVTDLTELKKVENALRNARDKAFEASEMKSLFLANMSHEIRTPMVSVIGMLDVLQDSPLNEEQKEWVNEANASANHLLNLINDILDISKFEADQIKLEVLPFSIYQVINQMAESFQEGFKKKGIAFPIHIDRQCPEYLLGDPTRLSQILFNLVGNALKFTASGEVALRLALSERAPRNHTVKVALEVSDTGIGIDTEFLPRLFQSFQQGDGSITRKFGGTGLGLSIVHHLVEMMKGEIEVESEIGKGTTFKIHLSFPVADIVSATAERTETEESRRELKVLIIEDNPSNQKVLSLYMQQLRWDYRVASNGKEGVDLFKTTPFNVVLMDLQMPEMDGLTAIKLIREWEEKLNLERSLIIAISADSQKEAREAVQKAGADGYVTKPVKKEALSEYIQKIRPAFKEEPSRKSGDSGIKKAKTGAFEPLPFDVEGKRIELNVSKEELKYLAQDFLNTSRSAMKSIEKAFEDRDFALLNEKTHYLKASVGFFADKATYRLVAEMKGFVKENAIEKIQNNLSILKKNLEGIQQRYSDYFSED